MKRIAIVFLVILAVAIGIGAWAVFAPVSPVAAKIDTSSCRAITLTDAKTGTEISGIEDMVRLPDGTFLLSAYDRLDPAERDGGVYALAYDDLTLDRVEVTSILSPDQTGGSLRPHGIALSPHADQIGIVNRGRGEVFSIDLFRKRAAGWEPSHRRVADRYCRANDLDFSRALTDHVVVSIDRQSCGFSMADMIGLYPTGAIEIFEPGVEEEKPFLMGGHSFPNGVMDTWIAETRAGRLSNPVKRRGRALGPIDLPGGPDNISLIDSQTAFVAVHPSLVKLGAYRFGWIDQAPSRVAQVNFRDETVEVLFDDPTGAVFSGATVAMRAGKRLVMGSVRDAGLLVCEGL
ncbi:MAG: hypothetical protein AAGC81_15345 [Pseudomonadota bacterium]